MCQKKEEKSSSPVIGAAPPADENNACDGIVSRAPPDFFQFLHDLRFCSCPIHHHCFVDHSIYKAICIILC
jgi:hypothetical protein